ncbi:MAG: DUF2948 family protein [Cypionkella sp.]|nr:DUF2948 family protein [Cypionkella sp.]
MSDARFQDAAPRGPDTPLRLLAQDAGDIPALSALAQDAVFTGADATFFAPRRRFALLLTRFRWEDRAAAEATGRPYERVKSLLVIDNVTALRSNGYDAGDKSAVRVLLALAFAAKDDLGGTLTLPLAAGGGAIAMDLETIDITLRDVTRPHRAVVQAVPDHGP